MDRNDGARAIGERIRQLREAQGLSQRQLSLPGVTASYISRVEKGDRFPSVRVLRGLAPKLGVSAEFLETGQESPSTLEECSLEELLQEIRKRLPGTKISIAGVI